MPALIMCTSCKCKLKVPEEVLGKTIKCPRCGAKSVAQTDQAPTTEESAEPRLATTAPPAEVPILQPVGDTREREREGLAEGPRPASRPIVVPAVDRRGDDDDEPRERRDRRPPKRAKSRLALWLILLVVTVALVGIAGAGAIGGLVYWQRNRSIDPAAWKDFSPPEGRCHVQMPGTPRETPLALNLAKIPGAQEVLKPKKYELDLLKTERIGFLLAHMDLPDNVDPQVVFDLCYTGERDHMAATMKTGVDSETTLASSTHQGKEFQVKAADGGMFIERLYLVKTVPCRVYLLAAFGPRARSSAPDVVKFFNSFSIDAAPPGIPKPKPNPGPNPNPKPDPTPQPVDKSKGITAGPKIEEFITAAVSPECKTAFVLPNSPFLKTYSYPEFKLTGSYPIGGVGYKSALDLESSVLYLAVSDPKAIQNPHSNHNTLGTGDIHVYNVQPILEGTAEPGKKLEPTAVIKLDATVASLLLSPDGKWLYYLNVKDPKNIQAGRIATATREKSPALSLAEKTEKMVLSRDGKMLYSASRTGKENEGRVYAIDPAGWKISKDFIAELDPGDFDATDTGLLFVVNASGGWTNLHVVDVQRGLVAARWRIVVDGQRIQFSPDQKRYYLSKPGGSPQDVVARLVPDKLAPDAPSVDVGVWTAPGVVGRDYHVSPDGKFLLTRPGQVLKLSP